MLGGCLESGQCFEKLKLLATASLDEHEDLYKGEPTVIAGFVHTKIKCYTLFPVLGLTLIRNLVDKIL